MNLPYLYVAVKICQFLIFKLNLKSLKRQLKPEFEQW